ncbi:MAG: (Fe-S)-binding protein [Deltaproteobacteria bacterium]|nr:(Fe-S)-binding protein [Deltaproteobacteria bacterium]
MALEDYRAIATRCSRCSYCKWIPFAHVKSWRFAKGCPSIEYNKFQSYSASGRVCASLSLLEERSSYFDEGLVDIVFKCMLDGCCDVACKINRYDFEPVEVMRQLRFKMIDNGCFPPQDIPLIDHLRKEDNMMMKPKADRGKWAEGLDVKDLTQEKAEVAFHVGCQLSYDEELWRIPRTVVTLLRNAGIDFGIMGRDENCCGGRLCDMGYRGEFIKYAENNIDAWTTAGVKTVVTACADGYHAFKRLYPEELDFKFEVLHITEFLERLIKEGKLKFTKEVPMTVTYHDPCHLGRRGEPHVPWNGEEKKIRGQVLVWEPRKPRYNGALGVYETPRNVLKNIPGIKLVEMERNREYAWCCGAGAGVRERYPEFSSWTAGERIEEAKATGAEAIVSACPWCERNFTDVINDRSEKMKVYDIVDLVREAI